MDKQNILEHVEDLLQRGEITADEANVELVRAERYRLITGRLSRDVRKALNIAVKKGRLGHLKKDGLKPEVYYHPVFKYMAVSARNRHEREAVKNISKVFAPE